MGSCRICERVQQGLARLRAALPGVSLVWADGGYAGKLVEWAKLALSLLVDIVRKRDGQCSFEVLPRRWVVERTFYWITSCRRLACDYERTIEHSEAMVKWAMIALMVRRLARVETGTPPAYNWCRSRLFPGVNDSGRRFFSITTKIFEKGPRPCPHEYHPPIVYTPRSTRCSPPVVAGP